MDLCPSAKKRKICDVVVPNKRNLNTLNNISQPPKKKRKVDHVTSLGIIIYIVL